MQLIDVAVRWENGSWKAYNIGPKPLYAEKNWSTQLGTTEIEEVYELFRNSNITILPTRE